MEWGVVLLIDSLEYKFHHLSHHKLELYTVPLMGLAGIVVKWYRKDAVKGI